MDDKRVAFVSGSSSGIGKAIALQLAKAGNDLVIHGRRESEHLSETLAEVSAIGVRVKAVFGDFSRGDYARESGWVGFTQSVFDCFGSVNCWVNNAGGDVLTGDWSERPLDEKLAYLWQTDVVSTLMLSRIAGRRMIESGDRNISILNLGWDQAANGMAGDSGELFATTKGAVMSMTKSLAQSLAPAVRVNCIAPGWIKTEWGEGTSEYWDRRAKEESLLKRWGTPEDIAAVAAFLCSDAASFITGQVVPVNGGFDFGLAGNQDS